MAPRCPQHQESRVKMSGVKSVASRCRIRQQILWLVT